MTSPFPDRLDARDLVLEHFVRGKRPDQSLCEDVVVLSSDFVAVVDGATDTSGALFDDLSGGRFAALAVAEAISSLPPATSAREALDSVTGHLAASLAAASCTGEPTYAPSAQLVMLSLHRREVWRVGDAHYALGDVVSYGSKEVDDVSAAFRRAYTQALLAGGADPALLRRTDPGFEAMWALVAVQEAFANRPGPFGYGVVNGTSVPDCFLEVVPVTSSTVTLASDGYLSLGPDLASSEAFLRSRLRADPLALDPETGTNRGHNPEWDSFDDRAWVRLHLPL